MPVRRQPAIEDLSSQIDVTNSLLTQDDPFQGDLEADVRSIRALVDPSDDIISQHLPNSPTPAVLVYQTGMADVRSMVPAVLSGLREGASVQLPELRRIDRPRAAVKAVLQGDAILLTEGSTEASVLPFASNVRPETPEAERLVRGPHQAFTPELNKNLALLRKLLQSNRLHVEYHSLTPQSESIVALCYLGGKAPAEVREEILKRLAHVSGGDFTDVTLLKPALADNSLSPFVNVQLTERVDTAALGVLHGRYAVFTSGSAQALLVPATFVEMMNSPEDRYLPRYIANFARLLRWSSMITALTLEPIYIAITTIHQELLPTPLAFAVARSRTGVPLPAFVEVLVMALIIEVLREAAIRLPHPLSQTIAIVGALVIGQAVVTASLISAPVVVIVALSGLASFAMPQYEIAMVIRILRFPAMIAAATLGLFGIASYFLALILHMAKLRSFGISYLAPLAPLQPAQLSRIVRWHAPKPTEP